MSITVQWIGVLQFITHLFFIFFFSHSEIEGEKYLDPKQNNNCSYFIEWLTRIFPKQSS